jgi:hypothetical protein
MNPRDRRAAWLIAAAAVLAVVWLAVAPVARSWSGARSRIDANKDRIEVLRSRLDKWRFERDRLAVEYGPSIEAPPLSADDTRLKFLKTLQDTLLAGGVQVQSIRPQATRPVKEIAGLSLATFQVTGKCQVAQLAQALARLTELPNLALMDRLSVDVDEAQPGLLNVTMQIGTLARTGARR